MEDFEAEVFAPTKPVVAISCVTGHFGHNYHDREDLQVLVDNLKRVPPANYTLIDYKREVGAGGSISTGSITLGMSLHKRDLDLNVAWIRSYLYERPAAVLVIVKVSSDESQDNQLESEIHRVLDECAENGRRVLLVLFVSSSSQGVSIERQDRLVGRETSVVVSATDELVPIQQMLLSANLERYYKEQARRYKKRISQAEDEEYQVPMYAAFRYQFKIGFMELFLGDANAALHAFHQAYTQIISYCNRQRQIKGGADVLKVLKAVRWSCDVIAYKVAWILTARGEKNDADEYMAGHVAWLSASFPAPEDEPHLFGWKVKMYDSMARILKVSQSTPVRDRKHMGYYCFLAADYAMRIVVEREEYLQKHVSRIIDWLLMAYEEYRKAGSHRSAMIIGRLIAIQHVLLDNYEQAYSALISLRKAFRQEGWTVVESGVLKTLMGLARDNLQDPKTELECYWEFANMNIELAVEELDATIGRISTGFVKGEKIILDCSNLAASLFPGPLMIRCAVRFSTASLFVFDPAKVIVSLCNMSPLALNISSVSIKFDNERVESLIIDGEATELIPGTFMDLEGLIIPKFQGPLTIEAVAIDLADLPIKLFFPAVSLSFNDLALSASFSDVTINWPFVRHLEPFNEQGLVLQANPICSVVGLDVALGEIMVQGQPCPLIISIDNPHDYSIECTIRFTCSGTEDVLTHDQDGSVRPLRDYAAVSLQSPSRFVTKHFVWISQTAAETSSTIHLDCQSSFTSNDLSLYPEQLSLEMQTTMANIEVRSISPFEVFCDFVPLPTDYAMNPNSCRMLGRRCDVLRYLANMQIVNSYPHSVQLSAVTLSTDGHFFKDSVETPQSSIMERGAVVERRFDVSADVLDDSFGEEPVDLMLSITWHPTELSHRQCHHTRILCTLRFYSNSLVILPLATVEQTVGRLASHVWYIWNMTDIQHDLQITIDGRDDFVYMGSKRERQLLDPLTCIQIHASIVPIRPGTFQSPSLTVTSLNDPQLREEHLSRPVITVYPILK